MKVTDTCYDVPLIPQIRQLLKCDVVAQNVRYLSQKIESDYSVCVIHVGSEISCNDF